MRAAPIIVLLALAACCWTISTAQPVDHEGGRTLQQAPGKRVAQLTKPVGAPAAPARQTTARLTPGVTVNGRHLLQERYPPAGKGAPNPNEQLSSSSKPAKSSSAAMRSTSAALLAAAAGVAAAVLVL